MRTWGQAWADAVYGPGGWTHSAEGPAGTFRTSAHSRPFARAIAMALQQTDEALGHPVELDLVDVGAGRGELLAGVLAELPPPLATRVRACAVELADRPSDLPAAIAWRQEPPSQIRGLVVANEWLDDIPTDVVLATETGTHLVLVDETGSEEAGPRTDEHEAWLERWWPLEPGQRAEVGYARDAAWAGIASRLVTGYAIAIDYSHVAGQRPPDGSLVGYRAGRQVRPVPDGSMNLTAHVAMDSVQEAGEASGLRTEWVGSQRAALAALGMLGERPPLGQASADPVGYVRALAEASERADLRDPAGLGAFTWLVQSTDGLPALLADAED